MFCINIGFISNFSKRRYFTIPFFNWPSFYPQERSVALRTSRASFYTDNKKKLLIAFAHRRNEKHVVPVQGTRCLENFSNFLRRVRSSSNLYHNIHVSYFLSISNTQNLAPLLVISLLVNNVYLFFFFFLSTYSFVIGTLAIPPLCHEETRKKTGSAMSIYIFTTSSTKFSGNERRAKPGGGREGKIDGSSIFRNRRRTGDAKLSQLRKTEGWLNREWPGEGQVRSTRSSSQGHARSIVVTLDDYSRLWRGNCCALWYPCSLLHGAHTRAFPRVYAL